jgi:hypothetical protein
MADKSWFTRHIGPPHLPHLPPHAPSPLLTQGTAVAATTAARSRSSSSIGPHSPHPDAEAQCRVTASSTTAAQRQHRLQHAADGIVHAHFGPTAKLLPACCRPCCRVRQRRPGCARNPKARWRAALTPTGARTSRRRHEALRAAASTVSRPPRQRLFRLPPMLLLKWDMMGSSRLM